MTTINTLPEYLIHRAALLKRVVSAQRALAALTDDATDAQFAAAERNAAAATTAYDNARRRAETNFGEREVMLAVNAIDGSLPNLYAS